MKKWIFPTFLFLFSFASGSEAQERTTLETCFITMPDALLPQLDVNARKDLLDLHKAGHAASVKGRMGDITLERLDEKMLLLSLSEKSTMQVALLPAKPSPVVAVVQTVKMPAADSRIDFYDTRWAACDAAALFTPPRPEDFFAGSRQEKADAAQSLPLLPVEYRINGDTLYVEQHLRDFLPEDAYKQIIMRLNTAPLVYRWNGRRFSK